MALLPQFQDTSQPFQLMQSQWSRILNPIISNPITNPTILKDVVLASGNNVINTRLGQKAQGWMIADVNAAVQIYRSAPYNDLTLTLNSSGAATVTLVIF